MIDNAINKSQGFYRRSLEFDTGGWMRACVQNNMECSRRAQGLAKKMSCSRVDLIILMRDGERKLNDL